MNKKNLKIVVVSSESVPYAKTGGLADVTGVLPAELKKLGHDVILIHPYYQMVKKGNFNIEKADVKLYVPLGDRDIPCEIYKTTGRGGTTVYFIGNEEFFSRDQLYGTPKGDYPDNARRFGFFSLAVIDLLKQMKFNPDIISVHDWQAGLVPFFLKIFEKDSPFFSNTKTVFTIHNLAYQGLFPPEILQDLGLGWDVFVPHGGVEFYGKVSFLKAGLVSSNAISTVSKKYSREIQTKEYGCGFEGILQTRADNIYGILNGVDYGEWSPELDKFIARNYSLNDLNGKKECRLDLLKEFKLSAGDDAPIIGIVSRLADQKGFDILAECVEDFSSLNLKLVLLGTGEEKYHKLFQGLQKKYPEHFGIVIGFNNALAHKIEAGSDMFLMPSNYEPCGLNQIYSLKYGTVPIVRATGGLDDTVVNFDPAKGTGNGFKFQEYSSVALMYKVKEALNVYKNKNLWLKLMQNGMRQDFSWNHSAQQYVDLFYKMLNG